MDWQIGYIEKEKAISANSGEIRLDLPENEQIDHVVIEFSAGNVAAASIVHTYSIFDALTRIRVESAGAKLLHYCTPEVSSFLAFAQAGVVPPHRIGTRGTPVLRIPIYFGRRPFDPEWGLDTAVFPKSQIVLEYSLNTTYLTSGSTVVTAYYVRPLAKRGVQGVVRSRVIETATTSGSAGEYTVDLPDELPLLHLAFRLYDIDDYIYRDVTDLEFNVGDGRLVYFRGRIEELYTLNGIWYGAEILGPYCNDMIKDGDQPQHFMGDCHSVQIIGYTASPDMISISSLRSGYADLKVHSAAGTAVTTREAALCQPIGKLPFQGVSIGRWWDAPLDLKTRGSGKVTYTLGAYTSVIETIVQERVVGGL